MLPAGRYRTHEAQKPQRGHTMCSTPKGSGRTCRVTPLEETSRDSTAWRRMLRRASERMDRLEQERARKKEKDDA